MKKKVFVLFLFLFLSLSSSLSSSGVLLNKRWRAQIKDALGIKSLEKQADCSTVDDKEELLEIITGEKTCPPKSDTSGTVSIPGTTQTPGTSGTTQTPGTSGTTQTPGTSGTTQTPGTSGTMSIPLDQMFIRNPSTKKCLQSLKVYPDPYKPPETIAILNTCSNTDKKLKLWIYDKNNKTLSTPEEKSLNKCLYLSSTLIDTQPKFTTCQPSNGLFQWEYNDDTKQFRNVGRNQCLNNSAKGEACTRLTSPQQEWEFVDPDLITNF